MFEMSTEVRNSIDPLRVLAKFYDWKLPTSGRSKLFIEVNKDSIMKEFINVQTRFK
jgi:hypothetical protein